MTAKHTDPEYRKNAAIVRARVQRARRMGNAVECWRCGHDIDERQAFDVGHRVPTGHALDNLAPEHRYRMPGICQGNRAAGGRVGAAMTNARRGQDQGLPRW